MVLLSVDNVGRRFGRRWLFRDISFQLESGGSLAITGANGSGKTTLLRILACLLKPTDGAVSLTIDGMELDRERHPLHTGYVAPYLNVYDGFTARENLAFLAAARHLPAAPTRIAEVLDHVQLGDRADERVSTYSSGMKARVKYAAALLANPPLLLLDEPSTNLDAQGVSMVRTTVESHTRNGGILIVATNNAAETEWCEGSLSVETFR